MAKKNKNIKRPKENKDKKPELLDKNEQKSAGYAFIVVFTSSIAFLFVYLVGLIIYPIEVSLNNKLTDK